VRKWGREIRARWSQMVTPRARGTSMWKKNTTKKSNELMFSSVRKERPIGSAKIGSTSSTRAVPSATCWPRSSQTSQ
jgi:hypothetical protein